MDAIVSDNDRAVIGGNNPPEPTPFELSQAEALDLMDEAKNWCDGDPISSQSQADALDKLLADIKAAVKRADDRRKEEARPHDEAKAEIQSRYNGLIGDTKTTGKGIMVLAQEAVLHVLQPWRQKVEDEKRRVAEEARREQEAKLRAAQEAFQKAREADNLATREEAEKLAAEAKKAEQAASKAEKAAVSKTGLRTVVTAFVSDPQAFAKWAWVNDRSALDEHFSARATALVRDGRRNIPGVEITETREAR